MRKFFATAMAVLLVIAMQAQVAQLTVNDKTANVYLKELHVDVKVAGPVATTTLQMIFENKTGRILEGELSFPLPEGVSVSRYAIDINGRLREAVPVEKEKGTQVFEAIERRRVDPGLLERTEGNNFRTRIYPIPANGTRTVVIAYEEELGYNKKNQLHYVLPLDYKKAIAFFKLNVLVLQNTLAPDVEESPDDLSFNEWNNNYTASIEKYNYTPSKSLEFSIPKQKDLPEVLLQQVGGNYYFLINQFMKPATQAKTLPNSIALLWDVSLSGLSRNHDKELALLHSLITKKKDLQVTLCTIGSHFKKTVIYNIKNGDWKELKQALEQITYDGGTNFSRIDLSAVAAEEYFLFSDGISSLSSTAFNSAGKIIHTITAAAKSDYAFLKLLAQNSGGSFINLVQWPVEQAITALTEQPLQFMGVKPSNGISETYPNQPTPVFNAVSVSGVCSSTTQTITLLFGYGNTVTTEKNIQLHYSKQAVSNYNLQRIWAQKKIAALDVQYQQNKPLIELLGKQFGIVTRNTSLIVLETVNDYLLYDIEPPAELRDEYDRLLKNRMVSRQVQQQTALAQSFKSFEQLMLWWNKDYKPLGILTPPVMVADTVRNSTNNSNNNSTATGINNNGPFISGTVRDERGEPVSGATVKLKGTTIATVTNAQGLFKISKPTQQHAKLVVNSVGFESKEVATTGTQITINLTAMNQALQEVVVVGYSTARRRDITGSTATIEPRETNSENLNEVLQGRAAGIAVTNREIQPGSAATIKIRGSSSVNGNATPLYVVDGAITNTLPPSDDIENVEILKDIAATSLYGSRAANGVVIVTTKEQSGNNNGNRNKSPKGISAVEWKPERSYLQKIAAADKAARYQQYLSLRKEYLLTPSFYFDVASYFLQNNDTSTGLQILGNLAELDVENHELYRQLGYTLRACNQHEEAIYIFKKVLQWRAMEPQSFRDYGLSLAGGGYYQQALDTLYTALIHPYSNNALSNYLGIEEVIVTEINQLVSLHKEQLDISKIDRQLLSPMPVDVRVVLNWNTNDTDIDLWVTDPNNEKCYYAHKNTALGGRISDDMTNGYGPEQFIIKKAIKGTYKIEVNYYGEQQVKLTGPATVLAEVYLHYASGKEERRLITLQMSKEKKAGIFIGSFDF